MVTVGIKYLQIVKEIITFVPVFVMDNLPLEKTNSSSL